MTETKFCYAAVHTTSAPKSLGKSTGGVLGPVAFARVVGMAELILRRSSVEQRRQH